MDTRTDKRDIEIDLGEIFSLLLTRLWIILFTGILCAIFVMIFSKFLIAPKYTTTTQVYVLNRQNQESDSLTSADLQSGSQLSKDYIEIIRSRTVLSDVIERLGLKLSVGELKSMISVSAPSETRSIYISVTDTDAYRAQQIADEVREVASQRICDIMKVEAVNVVDEAFIPTSPSSPNVFKNTIMGLLAGIIIAVIIIVIGFVLDDTIKTPDDVERYLGLSVLGSIPILEDSKKTKRQNERIKKSVENEHLYNKEAVDNQKFRDDEDDYGYDEDDDYDDYDYSYSEDD